VGFAKGLAKARAEAMAEEYLEQAREDLLRLGRKKFGPPSEAVRDAIAKIDDPDRLLALLDQILDVSTWDELVAPTIS
jgi:hypothetical protein